MNELYELNTICASDSVFFAGGQWKNDTRTRCPSCGMWDDRTEPDTIQISLNHLGRRGFVDYLWNSHSLPLFRQDLFDLWANNGLTGFRTKPVAVIGWHSKRNKVLPENIPTYMRLVISSKVRLVEPGPRSEPCPVCNFVSYNFPKVGYHLSDGIKIDPATWNGADFCGVKGYEKVFVSRRTAEITLNAKYNKHLVFIRLADTSRWEEFDYRRWNHQSWREYLETFLIREVSDL